MDYLLLGPLEVRREGRALTLGGAKQRALLAILLLNANRVVSIDSLVDHLWGDSPPETAANTIQVYVSSLRKTLEPGRLKTDAPEILLTRPPGYTLHVAAGELDLDKFRTGAEEGKVFLGRGDAKAGARILREALSLWRGPPLADFAYEPFAATEATRLEELRLAALEDRIDADLASGGKGELVGELEGLVAAHPLRERFRFQMMLALYRSGRQAEALNAYQAARRTLVDELGIDPSAALRDLEQRILAQDPSLLDAAPDGARSPGVAVPQQGARLPTPDRAILVVPRDDSKIDALIWIAQLLSRSEPAHELILAKLIGAWDSIEDLDLAEATADLNRRRAELMAQGVPCRAIAFNSSSAVEDVGRLAGRYPIDLVLMDGTVEDIQVEDRWARLTRVMEGSQSDVALFMAEGPLEGQWKVGSAVVAPFGGAQHDWGALQVAAWLAAVLHAPLRLIGTGAGGESAGRDASRLLADASLIVQQMTGVSAEPVLVTESNEVVSAARAAGLIVMGLSERPGESGLGRLRSSILRDSVVPTLILHRGPRSNLPTFAGQLTRFTWSRVPMGR